MIFRFFLLSSSVAGVYRQPEHVSEDPPATDPSDSRHGRRTAREGIRLSRSAQRHSQGSILWCENVFCFICCLVWIRGVLLCIQK